MPIPGAEQSAGVGGAAKQVAGHVGSLARLRLELARLELKSKAQGVGFGIGAAVVAFYGVAFMFATIAVALALVLETWLALLLVTLGLFTIAGILGVLARARLKSGPPAGDNGHG